MGESDIKASELLNELPSSLGVEVIHQIESHYAKQPDGFVYYYWRIVGSDTWNVQKTAMKEVPYTELAPTLTKED